MKSYLKLLQSALTLTILGSSSVFASSFQVWEQNVTNIENFHAGRAALAIDASTAYDNPAGLVRIKNQELVVGAMGVFTDVEFKGDASNCVVIAGVATCSIEAQGNAQGGTFALIPGAHYAAPLSDKLGFGLSVVAPFASDVEWGQSSFINGTITRARLKVVDIAPGFGYQVTPKLALGAGLDIEKMAAELNFILVSEPSLNKAYDTAYGYHAGALYEFSAATRLGLAYHSKVVHHLKGTSIFVDNSYSRVSTNLYLPPDTTLSLYHSLNDKWALMGTVVYTQWNIVHGLTIQNISGLTNVALSFPQNFRNSWTYSIGVDYAATDKLLLRAGGGYDQTPTRNAYRILQLPDSDRYDLAIGAHYQVNKNLGLDLGWTRVFLQRAAINPPLHPELFPFVLQNTVHGRLKSSGDVLGFQIKWDFV